MYFLEFLGTSNEIMAVNGRDYIMHSLNYFHFPSEHKTRLLFLASWLHLVEPCGCVLASGRLCILLPSRFPTTTIDSLFSFCHLDANPKSNLENHLWNMVSLGLEGLLKAEPPLCLSALEGTQGINFIGINH